MTGSRVVWLLLGVLVGGNGIAVEDQRPDFEFLKKPPGELVQLESHRLHISCIGKGKVTVIFEAGLGGSSLEWLPIQDRIAYRVQACSYDRAGYGWSDSSPYPRDARQLALEAHSMLNAMGVDGPLLLVGHSFGGFVVRMLARLRADSVMGMILVDSSHEDQFEKLEAAGRKSLMPKGNNFILSALGAPENLPENIRRKVKALSSLRRSNATTRAEMSEFRLSASQVKESHQRLEIPLVVLRRGLNPYAGSVDGDQKNLLWAELQLSLVNISTRGRAIVAKNSGHHVHIDEPELVVQTIEGLLDEYENK